MLEGMKNLSDLRIRQRPPKFNYLGVREPGSLLVEDIILVATRVLRMSNAERRKELRIQHLEEITTDDIIREETLFIVDANQ